MLFTWKRARLYGLLLCGLYLAAYASVIAQGSPPLNSSHEPIGGDYIAFYAAGRLLVSGGSVYDHAQVSALQSSLLGNAIPGFYDAYRNPPFYALLFVPLSALDLIPSFVVWTLLSLGLLALAVFLVARRRWLDVTILSLAFGPVYFGLIDGENATVSLLLYVLIFRGLASGRSAPAGVWAALGLFKPQLFFVWPIVFLVSGRWRALAAYAATGVALVVVSVATVGPDGVSAWLRVLVDMEQGNATRNAWRMHSLKAFWDLLLPSAPIVAWSLYALCAAALLAAVVRVWQARPSNLALPFAFTALVAVLVDPHLVDYDLSVLVPAAALAVPAIPRLRWLMLALYPLLLLRAQAPLGSGVVQLSVLALVLATWFVYRRIGPPVDSPDRTQTAAPALAAPATSSRLPAC